MTIGEAIEFLSSCKRYELRDHAFGDREVTWIKDGIEVADGYIGEAKSSSVTIAETTFTGSDAIALGRLGTLASVERNDSTGPEEYEDGKIMPSLTLDGVLDELTSTVQRPKKSP